MNIIKMLLYEKINMSAGVNNKKTDASKEFKLHHYWYFKNIGHKFEPNVCNRCHYVLTTACELKNIAILNVKGVDYRCVLSGVTKNETVNILNNSVLEDKGVL